MSRYRSDPEAIEYHKPSACENFLHYTWKTITCLFSHITLVSMVVSYCALGAYTFEALESQHERDLKKRIIREKTAQVTDALLIQQVKKNISNLRRNVTKHLWQLANDLDVFEPDNFTKKAVVYLKEFEDTLLRAMTKDGWNGEEDTSKVQWTRTGALFYSIIVITTIGYGHIAPKTTLGKVVTIFYAILGIPLMLLCLSNIGDIMATSFRFLYWRVCCYVCTKKPKKRRTRSMRSNFRMSESRFSRSRNASFRRSMRTSTRSADSGFGLSEVGPYSHSDTDLRYHDDALGAPMHSAGRNRSSQTSRYSDNTQLTHHRRPPPPPPTQFNQQRQQFNQRGGSLDRRKFELRDIDPDLDPVLLAKTPILCNRYVVGKNEVLGNNIPGLTTRNMEGQGKVSPQSSSNRRAASMPRNQDYLEPPRLPSPNFPLEHSEFRSRPRRKKSPPHNPSPKMMTPLGYGHRSKYLDDSESEEDYYDEYDDDEYYDSPRVRIRPVPIWLSVFLVVSYIIAGAFLFQAWENWGLLDAAYFCFITLTTIGFGDLVPARGVNQDGQRATVSIALCSLYLLFGIALLAMSFNLVQEEVIANVKSVAKTLGIIKKNEEDSEDEG